MPRVTIGKYVRYCATGLGKVSLTPLFLLHLEIVSC
jgi:hypothetical protein